MISNELSNTIELLSVPGKGILAADESTPTIGKRFETISTENNFENRRSYRSLLLNTPDLNKYINGVILFEETLTQTNDHDILLPEVLNKLGILPGIKVDKGLIDLANSEQEKITQGLDGLADRLSTYKEQGARFAKWRNVYSIGDGIPSMTAVKSGAEVLARYAGICLTHGIVPIVEPEVLINGTHDIEHAAEVSEVVLHELFKALFAHQIALEYIVLKPSMIISGADCPEQATSEEIANYTLHVFSNTVPAAVGSINFLSGGQSSIQATENLNTINSCGAQPWNLSFSYGRALQENALKAWMGNTANTEAAQMALLNRAQLNAAASLGEYDSSIEE